MTEFLYATFGEQFAYGGEETVYLGTDAETDVEIKYVVESRCRIACQGLRLVVPMLILTREIHTIRQANIGCDAQVFQYRPTRVYCSRVFHTRLPVAQEVRVKQPALLDAVGGYLTVHRIGHLDFLVPTFFAHFHFALERIYATHIHAQVG